MDHLRVDQEINIRQIPNQANTRDFKSKQIACEDVQAIQAKDGSLENIPEQIFLGQFVRELFLDNLL